MFATPKKLFRSLTQRLKQRFSRASSSKPSAVEWLGLNLEQATQVVGLPQMPAYRHYSAALEHLYDTQLRQMLRPMAHDAYLFQCGVLYAIEAIAALPYDLNLKLEEWNARTNGKPVEPAGDSIFTNTPFYDAYRRLGAR